MEICLCKNSAFKNKLSRLQFIETTVATLSFSNCNPYALVLDALKEVTPKTKCSLFGIEEYIKHIKKEGKSNCIVLGKTTHKDMVTDEV